MSASAGKAVGTGAAVAATLALLALPAAAGAQAPADDAPDPLFTPAEASAQLEAAGAALTEGVGEEATVTQELRDLALALPYLDGAERREARELLARPPDGSGEIFGGSWPSNATEHTEGSAHFVVHWPTVPGCHAPEQGCDEPELADDAPGNGVPDYIDDVIAAAEDSYAVENGTLGWPDPKPDGSRGGNSKVDVYVADICSEGTQNCVFGYASPDDASNECNRAPFRCFAYLVLDNDYQPQEFDYEEPGIPMRVTTAHEYNHILQYRIDTNQDPWMLEATAVWAEEQVFPDDNDWLFYVRVWARGSDHPLTRFAAQGFLRVYGSAVWNHWIDRGAGYGPDVVLDAWQTSRDGRPKDFAVDSYSRAIKQNGGPGFSKEFGRFAAATAEWRAEEFDFPDRERYPDVQRLGKLRPGGDAKRFELDHTAYRMLHVRPGSANRLALEINAPRGVRTAIALVAREGGAKGGDVTLKSRYAKRGGSKTVRLKGVQGFERITAVVVNADGRVRGSSRQYTRDNETFRAKLR
jgi:hypothetical protein